MCCAAFAQFKFAKEPQTDVNSEFSLTSQTKIQTSAGISDDAAGSSGNSGKSARVPQAGELSWNATSLCVTPLITGSTRLSRVGSRQNTYNSAPLVMVFFWKQPHTYSIWGFIRSGSDRSVSEIAANVTVNGFHRNESLGLEWERERKKARIKLREKDRRKMSLWLLRRSSAVRQTLVQGKKFGRCFHFPVPFFFPRNSTNWVHLRLCRSGPETDVSKKEGKIKPKASAGGATGGGTGESPFFGWSHNLDGCYGSSVGVIQWSSDNCGCLAALPWPAGPSGTPPGLCVCVWHLSLLLVRSNDTCFMAGSLVLCHTPQADRRGNILICVSSR